MESIGHCKSVQEVERLGTLEIKDSHGGEGSGLRLNQCDFRSLSVVLPDKRKVRPSHTGKIVNENDLRQGIVEILQESAALVARVRSRTGRPARVPALALRDNAIYSKTSFL